MDSEEQENMDFGDEENMDSENEENMDFEDEEKIDYEQKMDSEDTFFEDQATEGGCSTIEVQLYQKNESSIDFSSNWKFTQEQSKIKELFSESEFNKFKQIKRIENRRKLFRLKEMYKNDPEILNINLARELKLNPITIKRWKESFMLFLESP